jgi:hypothetical protein
LRKQLCGVDRGDAAAIKQPSQTGDCNIFFFEFATNERVNVLRLLRRRRLAGADRPHRFVPDQRRVETRNSAESQDRFELFADDVFGFTTVTLLAGFTDTKDGGKSSRPRGREFSRDAFVAFAVIAATLRMTHQYIVHTDFRQHRGAYLAGIGALTFMFAYILRAPLQGRAGKLFAQGVDVWIRGKHGYIDVGRHAGGNGAGQVRGHRATAVHLPVSGHKFSAHGLLHRRASGKLTDAPAPRQTGHAARRNPVPLCL